MQSKSSTSTLLIVLLLVLTFPLWLGIAGGILGLVAGLFGAVIGIFAGVIGAIFGVVGGIFGWVFDWHWPHFFHWNVFTIALIAIVVVLLTRSRRI